MIVSGNAAMNGVARSSSDIGPGTILGRMSKALYIGRFQPFHNGHLEYARMMPAGQDLTIVIGSSQEKGTLKNPFSADERMAMIKACLRDARVITAMDYPEDNERWTSSVIRKAGRFDIVFAGENELIEQLFKDKGYEVNSIKRIRGISGTRIRELIAQGREWKEYVPVQVYDYIRKIKGDERIRQLNIKLL